ncbi:hypothetical protein GCK72_008874 [Caenorhabditis remanei]|uniref:Sdz-33 F-box domain-containing protein n=2 Tax=Caenorhabditis remanei TaxID=31234 RepID=A0A6A5H149_CAERE|nr:hypothetical protein GCK72_008874 [Caenorhabditis remanei]KAF1760625.1 hypothetical protein GCK72_008874 [Caenorhabditis remanei]
MPKLEIQSIDFSKNKENEEEVSESRKTVVMVKQFEGENITIHVYNIIATDIKEDIGKIIQSSEVEWEYHHDPSVNLTGIFCNNISKFYNIKSPLKSFSAKRQLNSLDFDHSPNILSKPEKVYILMESVSTKELDMVFSKCQDMQHLLTRAEIPDEYDNYGIWNAKEMWLRYAPPTIEGLLNMNYERLICRRSKLKTSDLNLFLKKWLQSTEKEDNKYNINEIRLSQIENDSNIFEDLPVIPWNPRQRGQFFFHRNPFQNFGIDCSRDFDLLRDDGVLATVSYVRIPHLYDQFYFYVWRERFHVIPNDEMFNPAIIF